MMISLVSYFGVLLPMVALAVYIHWNSAKQRH